MGAFSTISAPYMTQPPGAVVILHRAAACQKEDFFPPTRGGFGGRQDKKRVFEENVKIQAATARREMGVPLWNRRRYTAVHLLSCAKWRRAALGSP